MAQHDMNIANQSFPSFRTDLNNALSAINTMHSGTSRPSGAAAGTMWLDTTSASSPTIKFFDGTDDISFATIDYSANTVNFLDSVVGGVSFKEGGTDFTNSLLVGHSTTGTLSSAEKNVGVGIGALDSITSGDDNTAIGYNAGTNMTAGVRNTFIGSQSGENNSGNYNTNIGQYAGRASANACVHIGYQAGYQATGTHNISVGNQSAFNLTSGAGNVTIGPVNVDSATTNRQLKIAGYDGSTTTTWISGGNDGVVTFNAANVSQQALTSSSNAVAWDASAKPNAYHLTTENTTFSAPTNAVEGAFICLEINYDGAHTIAFNTVFEFAGSTAPTFTSTDGKTDILVFRYSGSVWQEVGRTLNLSES